MSTTTTTPGGKRPPSGSIDTPQRDKRMKTIACDRCRRRKVKCDGDGYNHTPCKYCVSVNLDCTYGQKTGRTSGNNQSSSSKTNSRQTSRTKSTATNNTDNVVITTSTSTTSTGRQRRASSHSISHQNTKQITKKSSQSSSNINRPPRIIPQVLPTFDSKKHDFEHTIKLFTSVTLQDENQVRQQIKNYVQIPQVEEPSPRPQPNNTLLENTQLTGQFVELYFKNFHPFWPILHKDYFMQRFYDKNKSIPSLLLCAICAIGSGYSENPAARKDGNDPYTVGLDYYEYAQEMVNQYFDLPRLSTATALFLLGIFDALRSLKSRMYVGMATTLAITMRLHDKNAFPENLSVNEREARKRLWWSIAMANQLQCITLNRTLALQDNHCTIGYPNEIGIDDTECKIIEYFKHYIMITKILYDILEVTLSENCNEEIQVDLENRLNAWKEQLPQFLSIEGVKELNTTYNETTIEHLRIYLCILYNYAMIRIHHPSISTPLSMAHCTRAANNITSYVNDHFVNMINRKQFIVHCVLYAGFIHIRNLKDNHLKDPQHSKESGKNIAKIIKLFQNILNISSLHYIHYGIKNLIAIFATQLEVASDVEEHIMDIVKPALNLVSGNNSSSNGSPGSPATQLSIEESRNNSNNNNDVSNIVQDNSPMSLGLKKPSPIQQSAQNSPPGINLLAHTAATRSPHYPPLTPINHGPAGLQSTQSIYTTSPAPLEAQYIHNQTRHDNNSSTWGSNYNYQWPSNHLQPIQTQQHPNVQQQTTISPTGSETQAMMVINNPVTTSPSLRTMSMTSPNSSSLPPLLIATTNTNPTFTSSQMQFPYQTSALPSMSFPQFSASQQQHSQHSSQARQFPSTIGIGGNFVTGNDMSTGLAPMTGMIGNNGGVTNGMMSTSENSVSMLIDSQGSGDSSISQSGELDAQQSHHRRSSQPNPWWD